MVMIKAVYMIEMCCVACIVVQITCHFYLIIDVFCSLSLQRYVCQSVAGYRGESTQLGHVKFYYMSQTLLVRKSRKET